MTILLHPPRTTSIDLVTVFEARCWARARLFAEGELDRHDAVDKLQGDVVRDSLDAVIGQDRVQAMMSEAFGAVRAKPTAWDLGKAFCDHRGILSPATLDELESLVAQGDPARFGKWLCFLTVAERIAINDLVAP
jgi:hypothetical protein